MPAGRDQLRSMVRCRGWPDGATDVVLRLDGGYVPGDVKATRWWRAGPGEAGPLHIREPSPPDQHQGWVAETTSRFDDYLQLAHYWRMLKSIGRAPRGPATAPHHLAATTSREERLTRGTDTKRRSTP